MKLPAGLSSMLARGIAPVIAKWAVVQERRILGDGEPLDGDLMLFAGSIGISHPDEIRVLKTARIPLPVPEWMFWIGSRLGFPVFRPIGMALGRGIYLVPGHESSLRHELVHVMQYEREGGIGRFMNLYLRQCLVDGYLAASLEEEARIKGNFD